MSPENDSPAIDDDSNGVDLFTYSLDDLLSDYLRQARETPLLTAEEEVVLAKQIEEGRLARKNLNDSEEREIDAQLLQKISLGISAEKQLVAANTLLVVSIARKYQGHGVPLLDLVQEGNTGLVRAVKKFDYKKGHKFSTYATWWIRQAVTRSISDQSRNIRIPVHRMDTILDLLSIQAQLTQKFDRKPSLKELALAMGKDEATIAKLLQDANHTFSLDSPAGEEGESTLADLLPSSEPSPEDAVHDSLLREKLATILNDLPPRERLVLELRHGLLDGTDYTLEEIGKMLEITRERVRQIESKALGKLRHPSVSKMIKKLD